MRWVRSTKLSWHPDGPFMREALKVWGRAGSGGARWFVAGWAIGAVAIMAVIFSVRSASSESTGDVLEKAQWAYARECASCHGPNGDRLPIAPLSSREFLDSRGDTTLMAVMAGGKGSMPGFGVAAGGPFREEEIRGLVAYLNERAGRPSTSVLVGLGKEMFTSECERCHGANGDRIPIAPLNAKGFLDMKTDMELREVIANGKGLMPAFAKEKGGRLRGTDVEAIAAFLRFKVDKQTFEMASRGRDLYTGNCLSCHGAEGKAIAKVELGSAGYLQSIGDGGLITAISRGKGVMPAFSAGAGGSLSVLDIASLLVYLKTWAGVNATAALIASMPGQGQELFLRNCTGCHGEAGDRVPGVRLLSKEFLERETDAVVVQTITRGNAKGMPAWGRDAGGPMTSEQVQSLVAYLKSSALSTAVAVASTGTAAARPMEATAISAEMVAQGKTLYNGRCAACHGETRDKVPTCQLADPGWLQGKGFAGVVQDASEGKPPMMPAWGDEKGGPLSAGEIRSIVAYLWDAAGLRDTTSSPGPTASSPPPAPPKPSFPEVTVPNAAAGKQIFMSTCIMCHGETGMNVAQCPIGSLQWLNNIPGEALLGRIRSGKPSAGMPTWGRVYGGPMDDNQIESVALYLREAAWAASR